MTALLVRGGAGEIGAGRPLQQQIYLLRSAYHGDECHRVLGAPVQLALRVLIEDHEFLPGVADWSDQAASKAKLRDESGRDLSWRGSQANPIEGREFGPA